MTLILNGVKTIGLIHNKIGLEPRWYIGGYNFVLSHLTDLRQKPTVGRQKNCALLFAPSTAPSCSIWILRFPSIRKPCSRIAPSAGKT